MFPGHCVTRGVFAHRGCKFSPEIRAFPGVVRTPILPEIKRLRVSAYSSAGSQHSEKYCLDIVR